MTQATRSERAGSSPWSLRPFRLLVVSQVASTFGDRAMSLVLAIWTKEVTGSSSLAGLIFFAYGLPILFAPIWGTLVDRTDRRRLLIATQVLGIVPLVPLLLVDASDHVWRLFLVSVFYGAVDALYRASRATAVAEWVPPDLLPQANALSVTASQVTIIAAPLIGAGIYGAFGPRPVVAVDLVTYVVAALLLALLPRVSVAQITGEPSSFLRSAFTGITYVLRDRWLRRLFLAGALLFFAVGFFEPVVFQIVTQGLHRHAPFVSVLLVVQGIGAALAGVFCGGFVRRWGNGATLALACAAFAASCLLFVLPQLVTALLATALLGVALSVAAIAAGTAMQLAAPQALRGRVLAAGNLCFSLPQTLAIAAGSGLILAVDFRVVLGCMAVVGLAAAISAPRTVAPEPR